MLRIDHFRGFDSYYAIPYGAKDARNGRWRQGPGMKLFRAVEAAVGRKHHRRGPGLPHAQRPRPAGGLRLPRHEGPGVRLPTAATAAAPSTCPITTPKLRGLHRHPR